MTRPRCRRGATAAVVASLALFALLTSALPAAADTAPANHALGSTGWAGPASAPTAAPSSLSTATGPDVSSWQHPGGAAIDWAQVAASGQSFTFIKATEGPSTPGSSFYTNPWFPGDWAAAGAAGLYRGAYHFAEPALPLATAQAQASAFVAVAGRLQGSHDLPPVLDLEATGGLSPTDLTNWVQTWLISVQSLTGRVPMIYTSPNFWASAMAGTTSLSGFRLWLAGWTTASQPPSVAGWGTRWNFWQFTDAASVPGIVGGVDLSRYRGPAVALEGLAGAEIPTTGPSIYLRDTNSTGIADVSYRFGAPSGGVTLMCDWDGDGVSTPGVFVNGTWYVTNSATGGFAQMVFGYGQPGDIPVCGDWDGNGTQTPGIVRNGTWYLSNHVGNPFADLSFGYGDPGDHPVVGDWTGSGHDSPGVVRTGTWYLADHVGSPFADHVFHFGNPSGDTPVVGDWNHDGRDTPGVVRSGTWYLVNSIGSGLADLSFGYGNPTDGALAGQWQNGSSSTVGIAR